jgi:hypothetical protein
LGLILGGLKLDSKINNSSFNELTSKSKIEAKKTRPYFDNLGHVGEKNDYLSFPQLCREDKTERNHITYFMEMI